MDFWLQENRHCQITSVTVLELVPMVTLRGVFERALTRVNMPGTKHALRHHLLNYWR